MWLPSPAGLPFSPCQPVGLQAFVSAGARLNGPRNVPHVHRYKSGSALQPYPLTMGMNVLPHEILFGFFGVVESVPLDEEKHWLGGG